MISPFYSRNSIYRTGLNHLNNRPVFKLFDTWELNVQSVLISVELARICVCPPAGTTYVPYGYS